MSAFTDPSELIARYSLSEHIKFADDYFKGREDHLYLYQKPFHHPRDCAPLLSNLGQLLAGSQLKAGMRVLDFAAGSCWLSRILVELGCVVTSCDVSATALAIGRALFEKHPPISKNFTLPSFSVFNGEQLDFPDHSFDRVIVNDAFHHVPNTEVVLGEFSRVLQDNGLVAMSEPGRHHSKTQDSQYEMNTFNVIENDLAVEQLWAEAQRVGFKDVRICPVVRRPYLTIGQYLDCIRAKVPARVTQAVVQDTTNHSIFFLYKQPLQSRLGDPNPAPEISQREVFDEDFYLNAYPDVAAAVDRGKFIDGWHHYEKHGRDEGRRGSE